MKKLTAFLFLFFCLTLCSFAQVPSGVPQSNKILIFTPPLVQPASCASQTANAYWCGFRTILNKSYVYGLSIGVSWNTIEQAQQVYTYSGASSFDANIQEFTGFNASASCDGAHCVYTLSSSIGGVPLYQVNEQIVAWGFTPSGANTAAAGCTLNAVNNATPTVTCPSAFNGTATGGFVATACGGSPNGRCYFDLTISHEGYGGNNTSSPSYVFTGAWATSCCATTPLDVIIDQEYYNKTNCTGAIATWQPTTAYAANSLVFGLSGTNTTCTTSGNPNLNNHVYLLTNGPCTSGGSNPGNIFPTNGTTGSTDNGCLWQDQGNGIVANANSVYAGVTLSAGHAAGWEAPWIKAWENLATSAVAHYSAASWASQILSFRWGLVVGGESYLFGSKTAVNGLFAGSSTNARLAWVNALSVTQAFVATQMTNNASPFAGMATGNGCTAFSSNAGNVVDQSWADAEYTGSWQKGFYLGTEGLQVADLANLALGFKCVTTPGPGVGNDYAYNALRYASTMKYFEFQTTQQSCPTGAVDCTASEIQTGSLTLLLPFVTEHGLNLGEIYAGDFLCAELAAYTGPPTFAECAATSPTYHQALLNFAAAGQGSTVGIVGTGGLRGNATLQ